jgi:HEAT repeat protein
LGLLDAAREPGSSFAQTRLRPSLRRPRNKVITTAPATLPRARPRCAAKLACVAALIAPLAHAESLDEYLASGALKTVSNPVPINYFLEQAPSSLPEADRARVMEQINLALRHQTSTMNNLAQGLGNMFGGNVTQQTLQQMRAQASTSNELKRAVLGHFGVSAPSPNVTQRQMQAMQEETQHGITDPWIRGIESARALERLGDVQGAARFYMSCIQFLPPDWLADHCLNGILSLGPARAHALLIWAAANAESAGMPGATGAAGKGGQAFNNVASLRAASLRGLGALVGSGLLTPEQQESAMQPLLRYAGGKDNAQYWAAAAMGLGRARDPRGLGPLHELAGDRKDPQVESAALHALGAGFHESAALAELRRRLDDKSAEVQFAAADALLEAGDEAVYQWAREIITSKRAPDAQTLDLRPRVVRTLVAHPDARSRQALEEILHQGAGNDWLNAWIAVGLLEMGDGAQLAAVEAAVRKSDWTLDRATLGSAWRKIRPLVHIGMSVAMSVATGGMSSAQAAREIARVVINMGTGELAKVSEFAADREVASLQLRFQACQAFAGSNDPAVGAELTALVADPQPAVRLSAAHALALRPDPASLDGLIVAYHADFGAEEGTSRTPEVRAALLRAALNRAPADPRTRALVEEAAASSDPGIRFVGLVAATQAAPH